MGGCAPPHFLNRLLVHLEAGHACVWRGHSRWLPSLLPFHQKRLEGACFLCLGFLKQQPYTRCQASTLSWSPGHPTTRVAVSRLAKPSELPLLSPQKEKVPIFLIIYLDCNCVVKQIQLRGSLILSFVVLHAWPCPPCRSLGASMGPTPSKRALCVEHNCLNTVGPDKPCQPRAGSRLSLLRGSSCPGQRQALLPKAEPQLLPFVTTLAFGGTISALGLIRGGHTSVQTGIHHRSASRPQPSRDPLPGRPRCPSHSCQTRDTRTTPGFCWGSK